MARHKIADTWAERERQRRETGIDREVVDMVPLGVVRPGTQTVALPAALDLARFPLVDVSVEPLDGDPTHSGVSVARGELDI